MLLFAYGAVRYGKTLLADLQLRPLPVRPGFLFCYLVRKIQMARKYGTSICVVGFLPDFWLSRSLNQAVVAYSFYICGEP